MKFESIAIPQIDFDPRLDNENIFSEVFGSHTQEEWNDVLIKSIAHANIEGIEFPTFPPAELQNRIHGHDGVSSLNESAAFYKFACDHQIAGPASPWFRSGYFLDFGSGWGRILRHFMRDFPLKNIIGYEPNGLLSVVARTNNPFVSFLSGGHMPDGILPEAKFDLIVGWSVYSHLSQDTAVAWLTETARILNKGGVAMFSTWGLRFLERLKAEQELMASGEDIHWYSKICLLGAGDINKRIDDFNAGEFVWFNSLQNSQYGEAFISRAALLVLIKENALPVELVAFDSESLAQDVFILRRR